MRPLTAPRVLLWWVISSGRYNCRCCCCTLCHAIETKRRRASASLLWPATFAKSLVAFCSVAMAKSFGGARWPFATSESRTHPLRAGDFAWSLKGSSPMHCLVTPSYRATSRQTEPKRAVTRVFPVDAYASDSTRSPHLTATPPPVMRTQRTEPVVRHHARGGGGGFAFVGGGRASSSSTSASSSAAARVSSRAARQLIEKYAPR